ncbi:spore germination protein [Bacillus massiliglaciei]|uniref:spore germination protein n=1 Tax=Bacillus massiliglaciei TaxID=1816693 RepID=UPI000A758DC5|nr:spore germination protein [Bacillus massiliglaciei]
MNFFKKKNKTKNSQTANASVKQPVKNINELFEKFKGSADFLSFPYPDKNGYVVSYYKSVVNPDQMHQDIFPLLAKHPREKLQELKKLLPVEEMKLTDDLKVIKESVMTGAVVIQPYKGADVCLLLPCASSEKRQPSVPEVEFSVVGPKEAFVESLETNINLIRKRLPIPQLKTKEFRVGDLSHLRVVVIYLEGIADQQLVDTVVQRIEEIHFDVIVDTSFIGQMITDDRNSMFPQLVDTERPDRLASVLAEGKIGIMADGAPHTLIGPSTITTFFSSFEDYYLPWNIGTFFRMLRLFAVTFSIFSSPLYVAILTYHYQVIPTDLMPMLIASRAVIPLPPILEALLLEGTIELLREASVRLPTKVGTTIGTVGGIVIGTAAVQAGFVSNVLLMMIALAALASFTTPIYQIGNTVRLIRFPFLVAAQLYGLFGIAICSAFFLSHLLRLKSLGRPYLEPLYPLRMQDLKDTFIRKGFQSMGKRPLFMRPEDPIRAKPKEKKSHRDIDE